MLNFEVYNYLLNVRLYRINVIELALSKIQLQMQLGFNSSRLMLNYINLSVELDELI